MITKHNVYSAKVLFLSGFTKFFLNYFSSNYDFLLLTVYTLSLRARIMREKNAQTMKFWWVNYEVLVG